MALGLKITRMMRLPGREENFDYIFGPSDTCIHECDGQTNTGRQLVPRLYIASRSKSRSS